MEIITDKQTTEVTEIAESLSPGSVAGKSGRPVDEKEKDTGNTALPDSETVKNITSMIQEGLDSMNIKIAFSTYGDRDDRISVVVKDKETGEVIREMPPEELQRLHVKMEELMGLIFNDRI